MKNIVRFSSLVVLAVVATACAGVEDSESGDSLPVIGAGDKAVEFSDQEFAYAAPEDDGTGPKEDQGDLSAKGSAAVPRGVTFLQPVTIGINQQVSYQTSAGSAGVDPVLVLFRRHDNAATIKVPAWNHQEVSRFQTLAINDDSNGTLHSSITYTNTSGRVENAFLMAFAYGSSVGTANLTGFGTVNIAAGSARAASTSGTAFTTGGGDPWLFLFDSAANGSNAVANDDAVGTESRIQGITGAFMWYVAHGFNAGTTTINW